MQQCDDLGRWCEQRDSVQIRSSPTRSMVYSSMVSVGIKNNDRVCIRRGVRVLWGTRRYHLHLRLLLLMSIESPIEPRAITDRHSIMQVTEPIVKVMKILTPCKRDRRAPGRNTDNGQLGARPQAGSHSRSPRLEQ